MIAWLLGVLDHEREMRRRRAERQALRDWMDAHPVERGEYEPFRMERPAAVSGRRWILWHEMGGRHAD